MTHLKTRGIAAVAAILFTAATVYSVRFAWADILLNRNNLAAATDAVDLMPLDSRAHYLKASIVSAEGADDETDLRDAVALNFRNANAWMALGIEAESQGDLKQAEEYLLQAASVDHTFKPAWTLANFYARSNRSDQFWRWIRFDLEMAEPKNREIATFDLQPLFDLCWSFGSNANLIFERAIPRTPYILGKYTSYLLDTQKYEEAIQAAEPIFAIATKSDLPILVKFGELMLARDHPVAAVRAWNAMTEHHLLGGLKPLSPEAGNSLTNGDLQSAPLQFGFDWRFARPGGIYDSYSVNPPLVKLDFDGEEPEHAEVMVQWFPALPGRRYRLETNYETSGFSGAESGLHWGTSTSTGGNLPSPDESTKEKGHAIFDFSAPKSLIDRLVLRYDRVPGTTRPKGTLTLYSVSLHFLP